MLFCPRLSRIHLVTTVRLSSITRAINRVLHLLKICFAEYDWLYPIHMWFELISNYMHDEHCCKRLDM